MPGLAGEHSEFLKKNVQFTVTDQMKKVFEAAKKAVSNSFDVKRRSLVIIDVSAEDFGYLLIQKKNENEYQARVTATNRAGRVTKDTGWLMIQVGSAALKPVWQNYTVHELEATCVVWTLESLAYYQKGCPELELWKDHSLTIGASNEEGDQGFDTKNAKVQGNHLGLQCVYVFCQGHTQPHQ